jgi:hypothetical protein
MADFRDFWVILEITLKPRSVELLYRDGFGHRTHFSVATQSKPFSPPPQLIGLISDLTTQLPESRTPPHNTGSVPLPIFLQIPDFGLMFRNQDWEKWLADTLGPEIDLNRVQIVRLAETEKLPTRRFRFGLPFRILTVGEPSMFGLDSISTSSWFAESPLMGEFGVSIDSTEETAEALRKMPRDILIAAGPSPALYDLISSLREELRPRLFINCSSLLRRPPRGVSVLHIPGLSPSRLIVHEIIYGLIHDMPLHQTVKSAERRMGEHMQLFTNPIANHGLRISDALLGIRREAMKLQASFVQPRLSHAMNISKVSNVLAHHSTNLAHIQRAIDTTYNSSVDFSHESRGLKPLVNAESEIRAAGAAAKMISSDLAALSMDKNVRDQLATQQRRAVDIGLERLDTDVFLSHVESSCKLQAGARYQLRVHIGNPLPGNLMEGLVPAIDLLLPDPDKTDGHELEIAIQRKEFALLSDPVQPAYLPRFGGSEPVYFTILAPREIGPANLRICIYYRNQLLQSFLLKAEIELSQQFMNYPSAHVVLEYSRTERFTNLDNLRPRAVSIAANSGLSDTHELFIKGARVGTVPLGDKAFTDAMDDIRAILLEWTVNPNDNSIARVYPTVQAGDAASAEEAEVVRKLADKGHELYKAFFRSTRATTELMKSLGNLRKTSSETIQVVRLSERFVFPWTLLYDFEKPESGTGDACLGHFRDANGIAQPCAHGARDRVYCINGFWGIRHRVEEFIAGGQAGDVVKTISPLPGHELVRMAIDCSVPGAQKLSDDLQAELGAAAVPGPIQSQALIQLLWQKPPQRPAVLLVLGHLETGAPHFQDEPSGQRIVLVPEKSWLTEESISNQFIASAEAWDQPRSLVLLMACGSATTNVDKLNDFVLALNAAGAGAIVGSECVVFSDFACEFAQYLTPRLSKRDGAGQATSLGQAMMDFRVQKMKSGNPLAFVFRSIGDADLTLQN